MYYSRVKSKILEEQSTFRSIKKFRYSALLDLVNDLEHFRYDIEAPIFLLSDLVRIYNKKLVDILALELGSPSFIRGLLGGASKDDGDGNVPQSVCSLTQLLYSNSVKRRRKDIEGNPGQQRHRETPTATYVGLFVHNATGSADLVYSLFQPGLSISNDRVQEIRMKFGNQICEEFLKSSAVLGYSLPKSIPRAHGFDDVNKILSSSTASSSPNFNRTVIFVFSFSE